MKKVAVTGGLACGKSSVCVFLKELGATTVSADKIVHDLLSPQAKTGKEVLDLLGEEVLDSGQLSRERIAQKVFENPKLLEALESLIHPAVADKIDKMYEEAKQTHAPLFIAEVPLLFEAHLDKRFDKSIAVISDLHFAKSRVDVDDYFAQRMQRQLSNEEKAIKADFVLTNNGTLKELKAATKKLYTQLLED